MKLLMLISTLLFASIGLCSCMAFRSNQQKADRRHALIDGIRKTPSELQQLIELANQGDATAASALGDHFGMVEQDREAEKYWLHKAAELGGAQEKEVYQSFLNAMRESN